MKGKRVMCNQLTDHTKAHMAKAQQQHLTVFGCATTTLRPPLSPPSDYRERSLGRVCLFSSSSFISLVRNAQLCFRISKRWR